MFLLKNLSLLLQFLQPWHSLSNLMIKQQIIRNKKRRNPIYEISSLAFTEFFSLMINLLIPFRHE